VPSYVGRGLVVANIRPKSAKKYLKEFIISEVNSEFQLVKWCNPRNWTA